MIIYIKIQFGWHILSIFDLGILRRKEELKFYEMLLVFLYTF